MRRPEAGVRRPEAGVRRPEAGVRRPEAGVRRPEAGVRRPEAGVCRDGGSGWGWERSRDSPAASERRGRTAILGRKRLSTPWTSMWITPRSRSTAVDRDRDGENWPRCTLHPPTRCATCCSHRGLTRAFRVRRGGDAWTAVNMWTVARRSAPRRPVATTHSVVCVDTAVENGPGCAPSSTVRRPVPVVHGIHRPTTSPTLFKETPEIQRRVDGAQQETPTQIRVVHPGRPQE